MEKLKPAVIVGVNTDRRELEQDSASLEELSLLAATAGYAARATFIQKRDRIDPAWYIGAGNARKVAALARDKQAEAVLFDFELSPVQLRNLEKLLHCRIFSRTEVILDIFERRARTREAKLQVELATLVYSLPRLRHMWPHLSRMAGGIGTRGPGEKQLEVDKRRLSRRIGKIKKDLQSVEKHRRVIRKGREHSNRAALVGYTNAGKSSLLNALAHARLFTESRLFATLDPATREVYLGDGEKALVTDTVGFIKRLPHTLIASFRSTLEEVKDADLLLHVVDVSSPDVRERIEAVEEVLEEIQAGDLPVLHVFNKVDLLEDRNTKASLMAACPDHVVVSARTGEGLDRLKGRLLEFFRNLRAERRAQIESDRLEKALY
jgi:GTP-binding protein HflX